MSGRSAPAHVPSPRRIIDQIFGVLGPCPCLIVSAADAIEMLSRLGKVLPRFALGASVTGDGLRERLRSSTFALLGLVTAVGLVLVGIAANQGWPDFVDSPIPEAPTVHVGEAGIASRAAHPRLIGSGGHRSAASVVPVGPGPRAHRSSQLGISSQDQLSVTAPEEKSPTPTPAPSGQGGGKTPASPAEPSPTAEPPVPAPPRPTEEAATPVPASPAVSEPSPEGPGQGHGKAKGHEKSHGPPAAATPPSAPPVPSVPQAPEAAPDEAPAPGADPGNGHGHAYGHDK
jgi:hypothetical protein